MKRVRSVTRSEAGRGTRDRFRWASIAALAVLALVAAGCGGSSGSGGSTSSSSTAKSGGTFTILANAAFGVADPAQNYTLQEW